MGNDERNTFYMLLYESMCVYVVCILLLHRLPVYSLHQLNVLVKFNPVTAWIAKYIKFLAVAVMMLIA